VTRQLERVQAHCALAEHDDDVARFDAAAFDAGDTVCGRLKGGDLVIGEAFGDRDEAVFWHHGVLGEAAGEIPTGHRPTTALVLPTFPAEGTR
jgi:hypothetical protein